MAARPSPPSRAAPAWRERRRAARGRPRVRPRPRDGSGVTARDAAGQTGTATSSANFTVVSGTPTLTLTAPTTAVTWAIGSTQAITFDHNLGTGATVVIDLSRDGGVTWSNLSPGLVTTSATTGSFGWLVSGAGDDGRARASHVGGKPRGHQRERGELHDRGHDGAHRGDNGSDGGQHGLRHGDGVRDRVGQCRCRRRAVPAGRRGSGCGGHGVTVLGRRGTRRPRPPALTR